MLQQDGEFTKELQRTLRGAMKHSMVHWNPVFDSAVPVVISFDDNYAPSGGALINSTSGMRIKIKISDIVVPRKQSKLFE
ncbi:hypothetical protein MJ579_19430 [Klebsiella pneumoniae]|nr:hypothetical protein MJ579_19430 [Klebsiella pneumoniae]